MKNKDLKINFRYLIGNIACLTVDSISGKTVHNDINNEEAIIIFNSLVGEKENCQTVKTLLEENIELRKQLEETDRKLFLTKNELDMRQKTIDNKLNQQQEFIKYLEDEIKELQKIKETELDYDILKDVTTQLLDYKEILPKYKSIIGGNKDE